MKSDVVKIHHGFIIRDRDIELAKYKYYFDSIMDSVFDVCYDYKKYITTPSKAGRQSLNGKLQFITKHFYESDDDFPLLLVKNFNERILLDYLDEPHCGDCIKVCCSCSRCYVEQLIGCNTMPDNTPYFPEGETSCEYQNETQNGYLKDMNTL